MHLLESLNWKKLIILNVREGVEELKLSYTVRGNAKGYITLETVLQYFKKLNICLSYDSAILSIHSREMKA